MIQTTDWSLAWTGVFVSEKCLLWMYICEQTQTSWVSKQSSERQQSNKSIRADELGFLSQNELLMNDTSCKDDPSGLFTSELFFIDTIV